MSGRTEVRAQSVMPLVIVLAALPLGCAETEVRGRDLLRAGPLRGPERLAPATVAGAPVEIDAGTDALTDDELEEVARALPVAFADELTRAPGRAVGFEARLEACSLRAGVGRVHTVWKARCRAALVRGDVVVARVEGQAVRRRRTRAITAREAEEPARVERNPQLDVDDSAAALEDAARHAALRLVDPGQARLVERTDASGEGAVAPDDAALLDAVRARLVRAARPEEKAAALHELARLGGPADGPRAAPFVDDEHPFVRARALEALGELGDAQGIALAAARRSDDDEEVRDAAARALALLCALHAPDARSSKSSSDGGGDAGAMPEASRNDSTWRQNVACSNR